MFLPLPDFKSNAVLLFLVMSFNTFSQVTIADQSFDSGVSGYLDNLGYSVSSSTYVNINSSTSESFPNSLKLSNNNGTDDRDSDGHSHSYDRSRFIKGHAGYSNTFNSSQTTSGGHTVGTNGNLSGRKDTADGAYEKTSSPDGAVYITTGAAGKATGASFTGDPYNPSGGIPAMYYSAESLGSTILEIESDGSGGQNMNVKFIRESGAVDDYFTIHKGVLVLSVLSNTKNDNSVQVFPVPSDNLLNIKLENNEKLQKVIFYNTVGALVKESTEVQINVSGMKSGIYIC